MLLDNPINQFQCLSNEGSHYKRTGTTNGQHWEKSYQRVTQFIAERIKPAFNKEAEAKRLSGTGRYFHYSAQDVLNEWEANAKEATDYGTMIHKAIEDLLNNAKTDLAISDLLTKQVLAIREQALSKNFILLSEQTLFSDEMGLAGTADLIMFDGKQVLIRDWKTNKEPISENANAFSKMLKPPFSDLPANDYHVYSIQLSLYANMLPKDFQRYPINLAIMQIAKNGQIAKIPVPLVSNLVSKLKEYGCFV